MAKNNNLQDFIQDLGDTIRKKKGTTAKINPQNFSSEIESIETATEPTLQSKSVTPSTSQQKVQPDAGYDGLSDVTVEAVTNNIDANIVSSNIRSGVTILGVEGNVDVDKPDQSKTVTPTTSQQNIVADTGYELAQVTVNAVTSSIDANIQAENIKSGVNILGVTGTLQEGITPEGTLEITENNTYDVTNYAWASVNVEADLNERVIVGRWTDGFFVYEFKENGILLLNGFDGTYTILGNTIQVSSTDDGVTLTFVLTYNRDADTLVGVGDDGIEFVVTRVPTTLITKEITENGTYKASDDGADGYSEVVVNVASGGGGVKPKSLKLFCANRKLYETKSNYANEFTVDNLSNTDAALDPSFDTSEVTDMNSMFYGNTTITTIPQYNTSNVTNMRDMFYGCTKLTTVPKIDTSKVTDMYYMFKGCNKLTEVQQLDTSSLTSAVSSFYGTFSDCANLTSLPQLNLSAIKYFNDSFKNCSKLESISIITKPIIINTTQMFYGCTNLKTVETIDMKSVTTFTNMFWGCTNLTNLTLKNITATGLVIGGGSTSTGTAYGHLLTVDSLINTIKELWNYASGSFTLTMGSFNVEKLANVYVKLITPTAEQIAADPNIELKLPCEVCASTDEGAVLIKDYAKLKNWIIN